MNTERDSLMGAEVSAAIVAHRPSRWRSFSNDNEVLRCCGQDFGNATRKARRGDDEQAWADWAAHVEAAAGAERCERPARAAGANVAAALDAVPRVDADHLRAAVSAGAER